MTHRATNHLDCKMCTFTTSAVADFKEQPTSPDDKLQPGWHFCSIEKASEADKHLVKYAVARVLEGELPLTQLLKLPHLLVHHVSRLF